ncbi:MAG: hypothetical protein MZV49_12610 [Rhodopseudomonas palustris]|nr:hypothetical protein [Rhodopseudomonas palustris]
MHIRNATLAAAVAAALVAVPLRQALARRQRTRRSSGRQHLHQVALAATSRTDGASTTSRDRARRGLRRQRARASRSSCCSTPRSRSRSRSGAASTAASTRTTGRTSAASAARPRTATAPDGDCGEFDPRSNQYVKLRGVTVTPHAGLRAGSTRPRSASSDWGMFDACTSVGQIALHRPRQHRRRAAAGLGASTARCAGTSRASRWPNYQGLGFSTGAIGTDDIYANDANWIFQAKYTPSPDWNATLIAIYALRSTTSTPTTDPSDLDNGVSDEDPLRQHGGRAQGPVHRASTSWTSSGVRTTTATTDVRDSRRCGPGSWNGACRLQPAAASATWTTSPAR